MHSEHDAGLVACPVCGKQVPLVVINQHLDSACQQAGQSSEINTRERKRSLQCQTTPEDGQSLFLPRPEAGTNVDSRATQTFPLFKKPRLNSSVHLQEWLKPQGPSAKLDTAHILDCKGSQLPCKQQFETTKSNVSALSLKEPAHPGLGEAGGESRNQARRSNSSEASNSMSHTKPAHAFSVLMRSAAQKLSGHHLFPHFISSEEEMQVLHMIETTDPPWKLSTFNGGHRGKRWGVLMDLQRRTVSRATHEMPAFLMMLAARMRTLEPLRDFFPTEANANSYEPGKGQFLGPHVDDRQLSTGAIVTLSLMSSCVMSFGKERHPGSQKVFVTLPPRSLQVLTREARYSFTHEIQKTDFHGSHRISVTFRQSPLTT